MPPNRVSGLPKRTGRREIEKRCTLSLFFSRILFFTDVISSSTSDDNQQRTRPQLRSFIVNSDVWDSEEQPQQNIVQHEIIVTRAQIVC
ncbi:hypothetical protein NDU88_007136 [Pleurodeles waltl]|uniref:Uncharacterized protein n=1 Tax=Pleurodeles waltl TaxID=8319 RepID=A0AAV7NTZ6_PLEWA|nr:hypothetical protein NDU88_007136 [Pleurodeles waltl]